MKIKKNLKRLLPISKLPTKIEKSIAQNNNGDHNILKIVSDSF